MVASFYIENLSNNQSLQVTLFFKLFGILKTTLLLLEMCISEMSGRRNRIHTTFILNWRERWVNRILHHQRDPNWPLLMSERFVNLSQILIKITDRSPSTVIKITFTCWAPSPSFQDSSRSLGTSLRSLTGKVHQIGAPFKRKLTLLSTCE